MGLTKQYTKYSPLAEFNIISSRNCNVQFVTLDNHEGRFAAAGGCEKVIIWDLRLSEKVHVLQHETVVVSYICISPRNCNVAVGYGDGKVKIFDMKTGEVGAIFSGHRSAITSLTYDKMGTRLASGSLDTEVIVWDAVAEEGLYRFSGHKSAITQVTFMSNQSVLISAAKDSLIKFWDLNTQSCLKTLVGHKSEIWGMCLIKEDKYLVTGCGDGELRVWKIIDITTKSQEEKQQLKTDLEIDSNDDITCPLQTLKVGSLLRSGKGRSVSLLPDNSGQIVGVHGTDNMIELFYFLSDKDALKRFKKRQKKAKKKNADDQTEQNNTSVLSLSDEVKCLPPIHLAHRPKSFDLIMGRGGELRILVSLDNNMLQLYTTNVKEKNTDVKCLKTILQPGHQSELRCVAFSSDNLAIVSGSADSLKVWNRASQTCLRTVSVNYAVSVLFVPGDRYVLVGLKDGKLLIIDVAVGNVLEEINAHETELWTIVPLPNESGCVTGSSDSNVKFWQYEIITDEGQTPPKKVLSLLHTRTLKLEESVLCVKISPDSKFIAVALLDSTVKIFFLDTFKFYLSLYGHKLPVLCMDISDDNTLIVTGSADRNVKIWGMNFGDCHKSIFAHNNSITGLKFVPRTHYFFTCGKDGHVKQWDGDKYEKILTLQGHIGEANGLAVSSNGKHVLTCGSDRVLRLFERTKEILVLQDEQEEERAEQEGLATAEETAVPGHTDLHLPSRKTTNTEKAAESILECLEICEQYDAESSDHKPLHPLMQIYNVTTSEDFLLVTLKRIRSSDLEEALLFLSLNCVNQLLKLLPKLCNRANDIELICKVLIFLLKLHHASIAVSGNLMEVLRFLDTSLNEKVEDLRDLVGYNLYGTQLVQRQLEAAEGVQLFAEATNTIRTKSAKRKQKEKLKRSLIVLNT